VSALSVAAVAAQSRMHVFLVGGTADLLILLAAFLAAPSLIAALAPRLIDVAGRVLGTPAQLALRNVARQGERLAAPVVILTIALHLVITVGAIAGSFERSVLGWLARGSALDLVVTSSGNYGERTLTLLDEGFAESLRTVPGVAEVRPLRENRVRFRGTEIGVRAWAIGAHPGERERRRFDFLEGSAREALLAVAAGTAALVSQNLAARFGLHAGDAIELPTPSGTARFAIAGVVMDYLSQTGTVLVERETYRRLWKDPLVDGFGIGLAAGASADETRDRIAERFGARFDLVVLTLADYLGNTSALIHRAFFPLRAIEGVTLAIGLLTLLNALLVSVAERFRELGILRANGASTGQLVRMILGEAVATGSIAALLGIAIGLYGSESWIRVHIPVATGWIVPYVFPLWPTALAVAGALTLGALAAVYPARLAARLPIVEALGSD
jgi:putative ABC transport system permease protein